MMDRIVKQSVVAIGAMSALLLTSCTQPPAPAPAPASEVGRFQIVVSSEGDRGAVLFLVDTKDGATWIFRPPQGPAINGFWSDIPRVTYPPEFWQRAFQMLAQPPQGTNSPATPAPPTAPAPSR